jgi:hypothetical protein
MLSILELSKERNAHIPETVRHELLPDPSSVTIVIPRAPILCSTLQ